MNGLLRAGVGLGIFIVCVFLVLFLGGLASAWFEIRSEKRRGVPVTRPARDLAMKRSVRKAAGQGGFWTSVRLWWRGVRTGIPQCWCSYGTLVEFPAVTQFGYESVDGLGCTAVEAGHWQAWDMHDAAGGYARVPIPSSGVAVSDFPSVAS